MLIRPVAVTGRTTAAVSPGKTRGGYAARCGDESKAGGRKPKEDRLPGAYSHSVITALQLWFHRSVLCRIFGASQMLSLLLQQDKSVYTPQPRGFRGAARRRFRDGARPFHRTGHL